eukprot:gene222-4468_t
MLKIKNKTKLLFKNLPKRFIVLPKFLDELKTADLADYDVKFYDEPQKKSFTINHEIGFSNFNFPKSDLLKLSQNNKEYILIGESYGFADFQDNPVRFHPLNSSYLWIDPESETEKVLLQLTKEVPPLLWIPLKPNSEALKRTFDEFMEIEAVMIKDNIRPVDDMLKTIDDIESHEKKRNALLEYVDRIDPKDVINPHPNTVTLYVGAVETAESVEVSMMNNSFIFNLPRIRGSTNKIVKNTQISSSKFESIVSRSIITIDVRNDLHMELEGGKLIPCFAKINYPDNDRMSRPCTARYNRIFGSDYPENMPIDVICAFFGNQMKGYQSLRREIKETEENTENNIQPYYIAQLAALNDPDFKKVFERFYQHKDPLVRIACLKGAAEFNMKDKIEKMEKIETNLD